MHRWCWTTGSINGFGAHVVLFHISARSFRDLSAFAHGAGKLLPLIRRQQRNRNIGAANSGQRARAGAAPFCDRSTFFFAVSLAIRMANATGSVSSGSRL